jgi:hypothetical protein
MMFTNFLVGLPIMLLCLVIQATVAFWCVRYYIHRMKRVAGKQHMHTGLLPLMVAMVAMMLGTLVQLTLWGVLFVWLGEFTELYEAVYHSAVNFASLGYGDVVMHKQWKMLGPLEAINGVLMLGMNAGALMAIVQHMIKVQLRKEQ